MESTIEQGARASNGHSDEAPFGYKADGTPRKRPAPVAAMKAAKERSEQLRAARSEPKRGPGRPRKAPAPAVTSGEAGDLLSTIRGQLDARLAELEPLIVEYDQLLAAREALPR